MQTLTAYWLTSYTILIFSRQFGNMLLLSTTYMSHLTDLVDRNELERLLRRTIAFLLRNRNISPTLRADAKILAEIYEIIFKRPPMLAAVDG